jgi:hypothetical protein
MRGGGGGGLPCCHVRDATRCNTLPGHNNQVASTATSTMTDVIAQSGGHGGSSIPPQQQQAVRVSPSIFAALSESRITRCRHRTIREGNSRSSGLPAAARCAWSNCYMVS